MPALLFRTRNKPRSFSGSPNTVAGKLHKRLCVGWERYFPSIGAVTERNVLVHRMDPPLNPRPGTVPRVIEQGIRIL